jgi:hypothetical protein
VVDHRPSPLQVDAEKPAFRRARASRRCQRRPYLARDPRLREPASGRGVRPRSERSGVKSSRCVESVVARSRRPPRPYALVLGARPALRRSQAQHDPDASPLLNTPSTPPRPSRPTLSRAEWPAGQDGDRRISAYLSLGAAFLNGTPRGSQGQHPQHCDEAGNDPVRKPLQQFRAQLGEQQRGPLVLHRPLDQPRAYPGRDINRAKSNA